MEKRHIIIRKNTTIVTEKTFSSPEEMMKFASLFSKKLQSGDVLLLSGDLGAGKTTFVKGLAKGLGISRDVTSPTFVIMNLYPISSREKKSSHFQLCHIDAYRLSSEKDLVSLGADEYIGSPSVLTALEWPERVYQEYPHDAFHIEFKLVG